MSDDKFKDKSNQNKSNNTENSNQTFNKLNYYKTNAETSESYFNQYKLMSYQEALNYKNKYDNRLYLTFKTRIYKMLEFRRDPQFFYDRNTSLYFWLQFIYGGTNRKLINR